METKVPQELIQIIEKLSEDQLRALYRFIGERLRLLFNMRALYAMRNFSIMDRVYFNHNGTYYEGSVTRLNQRTVTVTLDDGNKWTVAPSSLSKKRY